MPPFAVKRTNANGTVTIHTGGGVLHSINIFTAGTASNTIQVFDNTAGSGTQIAQIDSTARGSFIVDAPVKLGVTVVTATGTAADVTWTIHQPDSQ